jgi:hypothetical protein
MSEGARSRAAALGWGVVLLLLGYATWMHRGLGPPPGGMVRPTLRWYEPTAFLLAHAPFDGLVDRPGPGIALAVLPIAVGLAVVVWATRSAVARTIAVTSLFAVALFAFYGLAAERVWEFFRWRGSLVIALTALCAGAAATAPWLAGSWLRRGWPLRLAIYAPIFLAIVALERNPTGTDERLAFNFSPWPAVPIFGLEMGAYVWIGLWLATAAGLAVLATTPRLRAPLATLLGVGIPVLWVALRFGEVGAAPLALAGAIGGGTLALAQVGGREERREILLRRASRFALGALLAGLPLFTGRVWADADFAVTRHVRAKAISDALAGYVERADEYPETLDALVEQEFLAELPRPRVGFVLPAALGGAPPAFSYQNLGSSYVLEFDAPEWVQCAYNPPWEEEEEEEDDEGEASGEDDDTGEAWSCPDTRPDLW